MSPAIEPATSALSAANSENEVGKRHHDAGPSTFASRPVIVRAGCAAGRELDGTSEIRQALTGVKRL
jgi:hypothetical protein